jgi:hypothetical protein
MISHQHKGEKRQEPRAGSDDVFLQATRVSKHHPTNTIECGKAHSVDYFKVAAFLHRNCDLPDRGRLFAKTEALRVASKMSERQTSRLVAVELLGPCFTQATQLHFLVHC